MSKRTRRQFLEDSMFATAAAVAASSGGSLLAAEEEKQSSSPNERLNVAVVGVRGRGNTHIGAFAGRKDTEITYIVDPDQEVGASRVKEVEKKQGRAPKFVEDMRAAFDDPSVDIVSIATPNHWHALAAIWAIQAGKDVYVEKPVSHNVSEGRRIVEAARKYNKICQCGTQSRSNQGMIDAMEFVHQGGVGEVTVARGLCYKPRGSIGARGVYPVPANINYGVWLGPAPFAPVTRKQFHYDWHWQWPYGNGDLGNQGIHQMDLARWGLGEKGLSERVFSYGGRFGYDDAGDSANTQVVVHDYGTKSLVFEVRGLKTSDYKGAKIGVMFEGEDGYVVMSSYDAGAAFDKDGKMIKSFKGGGDHFGNFLSGVRSRNIADLNGEIEEGHFSSALCHMGNISYRLGEPVKTAELVNKAASWKTSDNALDTLERTVAHLKDNGIDIDETDFTIGPQLEFDTKAENFPGNEAANAQLTREYRAPFVVPAADKV
ncbi:Gfo/Idh/MocA family protein [Lignipirellula cremea]|uniref:Glucose--fructose oxidoreductase n=1 Tax=Lignipirellula cremea TaxID=2528010 RepID=A0A518DS29_9BACT|nr:Gfo/Idh/MocA family oxidoreductase [Lignipirellula cremea]QDU94647.1 Glucose--fructose oxidoreductase precursor [Lignipirellula cremea]